MSANDQQRPRGQPSHVSNGSGTKEEEAYLQQQPPHPMRAWSEQASDGGYGAGPMSTAVSDSFFPNYYPPNMSYPFMSQGMGGSEGAWSSGADTMFGMGYDYSNMYSGFGFPFNNWDYSGDYWGSSQPVRKDQRGYPTEDAYYPPEMIPADSYSMVNGGGPPPTATVAPTAAPAEPREPVANVEQGIRDMRLAYRKDNVMPQQQQPSQRQPPQQQQQQHAPQHHLQQVVAEGFSGEPPFMMPPSPVSATAVPSGGQSMGVGNNSSSTSGGDQSSGQSSSKKTSWAAIASQPARPQLQMRPRTIPRAPVHPGKSHNMDIGTWDTRGNPSRPVPMTMSQPLPNQPPSSIAARYSRQPLIGQRQAMPPPSSASVTVSNSSNNNSGNSAHNSNLNSSSSFNSGGNAGVDSGSGSNNSNNAVNDSSAANISSDSVSVVAAIGVDGNNSNISNSSVVGNNSSSSSAYSGGYSSTNVGNVADSSNNRAVVNVSASMNGTHGGSGESSPQSSQAPAPAADSSSDKLSSSTFYNPKEFVLNHKSARYFVIKSYSEDDIHRSIKYSVWCSTDHGNRRLDGAFREREGKGPVYLIFSVNGSGHFCGVAQMMTPVDYNKSTGIWHQDKWKGQIEVKWVYVKDVPNSQLRHIRLENNENKPVTNSRDTQEVPPEKGKQVLRIMHSYKATTSIFDDFSHYEKRQEEDRLLSMHREHRSDRGGGHHGHGGGERGGDRDYHGGGGGNNRDRDHQHHRGGGSGGGSDRGDRDNHHSHHRGGNNSENHRNYRNDYNNRGGDRDGGRDNRDHHQRYDGGRGGDNRNDNRDHGGNRGGFDREIRGRPGSMNDREPRRGGFRQH